MLARHIDSMTKETETVGQTDPLSVMTSDAIKPANPSLLPRSVQTRILLTLGLLVVLTVIGSPSGALVEIAMTLLLKNKLHLSQSELSLLRGLASVPVFISPIYGFIRDRWNPFGIRDRGIIMLFGTLTVVLYLLLMFVTVTATSFLASILVLRFSFRFLSSSEQGLTATLGQQHAMSGRIATVLITALSLLGAGVSYLGGDLSEVLERQQVDTAFHDLFLICAVIIAGVVLWGWWGPKAVFDNIRNERVGKITSLDDVRRLLRHRAIYPALLITALWAFAPGSDTALLYYLQGSYHCTDAQWGEFQAIFGLGFIPTTLLFGLLATRVALSRLLLWGTVIGIPQMVPLLFIHSMNDALLAGLAMGLLGGIASAAYMTLAFRSCPPGLQATMLMLVASLGDISFRVGDWLGANLSHLGGFSTCVIAITIVYALILPILLMIPHGLASRRDGALQANP
jgi:MFS family permease